MLIKIYISPRHPEEQPRVFVESPLYHIRVSKLGVLIDEATFQLGLVAANVSESPDEGVAIHQ
jgi:hypothetical protein